MPIEWLLPTGLTPTAGPGLRVHVQHDGPDLELPGAWIITAAEDEAGLVGGYQMTISTTSNTVDSLEDEANGYLWWIAEHLGYVHDGQQIYLIAKRYDQNAQLMDTGTKAVTWDARTGVPWIVQRTAQTQTPGFAEEDRVMLQSINAKAILDIAGELLQPVIDIWNQYAPTLQSVYPYPSQTCAPTILTKPATSPIGRWRGISWVVTQRPSGLGVVEGFPDHTYANWGQLSFVREEDDQVARPSDTRYEARLEGMWLWGDREPFNIQVYVLPGVCVQFAALIMPFFSPTARR